MATTSDGTLLPFTAAEIPLLRLVCVLPDAAALLSRYAHDPALRAALQRRFDQQAEATASLLHTWERQFDGPDGAPDLGDLDGPGWHLHLFAALGVLQALLRLDAAPDQLALALHRPAPGHGSVTVVADAPTLVLAPGSLVAMVLTRAAATPAVWALTAVAKPLLGQAVDRLLGPREQVLQALRQRQTPAGQAPTLQALQTLPPAPPPGLRRAIVHVHGPVRHRPRHL